MIKDLELWKIRGLRVKENETLLLFFILLFKHLWLSKMKGHYKEAKGTVKLMVFCTRKCMEHTPSIYSSCYTRSNPPSHTSPTQFNCEAEVMGGCRLKWVSAKR